MAISSALATILTNIAAISISGVTVASTSGIPEEAGGVRYSILYPRPDIFMDGFNYERVSQGGGSTAKGDMTYTLHYRYCHVPVGAGRNLADIYPGIVTNVIAIINAITTNDAVTGCVDLELSDLNVGWVEDPSGDTYLGADFALKVLEYQN